MNGGKIKKSSFKNGRGYCGYHTTWDHKKVFCRSLLEKIQCLLLDKLHTYYLLEKQIFIIEGKSYKPDFFIYEDCTYNKVISIIEIKGTDKECAEYLNLYKNYFNLIGIGYSALTYNRRYYKNHIEFRHIIEEYINSSDAYNMSGENNPSFGMVFSEKRLKEHSKLMSECQSRQEVRDKRSVSMKKRFKDNPELIANLKKKQTNYQETIRVAKYGNKKENVCIFCGSLIYTYELLNKQYCTSRSCKGSWCNHLAKLNGTCGHKHTDINKQKIMLNLLMKHGHKALQIYNTLTFDILELYKKEYCRLKSRFSIKSILKYYGDVENFIQKVKENYNENIKYND